MRAMRTPLLVLALSFLGACRATSSAGEASDRPLLVHSVYFTLKEDTPERRQALIDSTRATLAKIPGIVALAVGPRDEGLARGVNDLEFDLALTIVFRDRAAHDLYQPHVKHQEFIAANLPNVARVRVFDSLSEDD
jgi:hypothetical protein